MTIYHPGQLYNGNKLQYQVIESYLVTIKVLPYKIINPWDQWLGQIWSCQHVHLQHWEDHPINKCLDSGSMLLPGKLAASGLLTGWYSGSMKQNTYYDDVMNQKRFPHYWSFVRGVPRWLVDSPHTGQIRLTLMFSLMLALTNCKIESRVAGDLNHHDAHVTSL